MYGQSAMFVGNSLVNEARRGPTLASRVLG
jgi:hypothetical protein